MTLIEHLRKLGACQDGIDFATGKTAVEAWATCERPDWLCWWLAQTNSEPENRRSIKLYCRIWQRDIAPKLPEPDRETFAALLVACSDWAADPTVENRKKALAIDRALALNLDLNLAKQWCDDIRAEFQCPFIEESI